MGINELHATHHYCGLAYSGPGFENHSMIASRVRLTDPTGDGFFAVIAEGGLPSESVFILTDDGGRLSRIKEN